MRRFLLWLVMVAATLALILGGSAAFFYTQAGSADLPQQPVVFGGAELEPNGWDWSVPVLGGKLTKQVQSPTNLSVQHLGTFSEDIPALALPAWVSRAKVTVTAPSGVQWSGSADEFAAYTYDQNGSYRLTLTAWHIAEETAEPEGWYAYCADFTLQQQPRIALSADRAVQGSVVALSLSGYLEGEPALQTDLGTVWFRKTQSGYMGYIPVTYNAESGVHTLALSCGSFSQQLELTVTSAQTSTVTVEEDTRTGAEEYRNNIWPLFTTGSAEKQWQGAFRAPSAAAVRLHYGDVQMVNGARAGQATGVAYRPAPDEAVTAPQTGKVLFAGTLQLTGGTVVIDHGCGVKSYLYGLKTLAVQAGQSVQTGDALGTADALGVDYELRIGSKTVDPEAAMTGRGGLQFREYE